jgi:thiamine pyrophosphate-dependent acetolactate synthase large subunit-like protein
MQTGNALMQGFEARGLGHVFGVPGGQTMTLYDALREEERVRHVVRRDR